MGIKSSIRNGDKNLSNMSQLEVGNAMDMASNLSVVEQFDLYRSIVKSNLTILSDKIIAPGWLVSDFDSFQWVCVFGKNSRIIDFNVKLDDGSNLIDQKNHKLIYTIKYWICCQTLPLYSGGIRLDTSTEYAKIRRSIHIIDCILLNSKHFKIGEFGLELITFDDVVSIIKSLSLGVSEGVYRYTEMLSDFLKNKSREITDLQLSEVVERYPTIVNPPENISLDLNARELVYARVWLALNAPEGSRRIDSSNRSANNQQFIRSDIYSNTLSKGGFGAPNFLELKITKIKIYNEFHSVPIYKGRAGFDFKTVNSYISSLKLFRVVRGADFSSIDVEGLQDLNAKDVLSESRPSVAGRNRTLPASVVFSALKKSYEFSIRYGNDILSEIESFYLDKLRNDSGESYYSLNGRNVVLDDTDGLNISRWRIKAIDNEKSLPEDYYYQLRNNPGIFECYKILLGSIQIILGILLARRVSELLELKVDCLIPNENPFLSENKALSYSLVFENRKSGEFEEREQLARPILNSAARLVWRLKEFHKKISGLGLIEEGSNLFLNIVAENSETSDNLGVSDFSELSRDTYSRNLNIFCDYFETKVININGIDHRYYIRQHQLRRFFAMAFFWGSGYDGLDTLRWFLGHTDAEHLWHYITENTPGVVLRGVKAEAIINGINHTEIEGIEKLRELLKVRYGADDVLIDSLPDVINDFETDEKEGLVKTEPALLELRQQLEINVEDLLTKGSIDLTPTFLSIKNENGEVVQKIHLVVTVKDIINVS